MKDFGFGISGLERSLGISVNLWLVLGQEYFRVAVNEQCEAGSSGFLQAFIGIC